MKKTVLLFSFLILCLITNAQTPEIDSIKKYFQFKKDEFNGSINLNPVDSIQGKSKDGFPFVIKLHSQVTPKHYKRLVFQIGCPQIACTNNGLIDFVLKDETRFTIDNNSSFNCLGLFAVQWVELSGIYKRLTNLSNSPVSKLRLRTNVTSVEIDLTPAQSLALYNQFKWSKYYYDNKSKVDKANSL